MSALLHIFQKSKTCFKNLVIRSFRWHLDKTQKMSDFLMQTKTFLRHQKCFGNKPTPPSFQNYEKKVTSLCRELSLNEGVVFWCQKCLASEKSFLSALQNHSFLWILLNLKVPSEKSYNTVFKTGLTFRNMWF